MALRVYTNNFSVSAQRHLGNNNDNLKTSLERLSSGMRINRASDDAAGLAISEGMRGDIRSMKQAIRNANDGIGMINTAEGALGEQASMLIRMRELASQAATGTIGSAERITINREFQALKDEIDRTAAVTEFNGQKLLDGSMSTAGSLSVVIQIGIAATTNDRISFNNSIDLTAITSTGLAIQNLSVTGVSDALSSLAGIDSAIAKVTDGRGRLGALQNRLVHTLQSLAVYTENLTNAESQIRDADYAAEISEFTKNQILSQASTAILAQANLVPQTVLQLLG
ncbi:MAG: flagellin [Nitrospinota bacterium]|nr:flagellin [Nitrospinota bacterium]